MKRVLVLLITGLCFCTSSFSEKRYVIKKITDEGSNYFAMNKLGEIAYVGLDELQRQHIYLYSSGVIYKITENLPYSYGYSSIDINDSGYIVWSMYSTEDPDKYKYVIMIYDGSVRKLVDSLYYGNYDPGVRINNNGIVVWQSIPYYGAYSQVYSYNGKVRKLSESVNNPNSWPVINDNGLIAWYGDNRWQSDWTNRIHYINPDDTVIYTIPQGQFEGSASPQVDNLNNIVFHRYDDGYYDLYSFNGTTSVKITDSIYQNHFAVNNGNIVYTKGLSGSYSVYRYTPDGSSLLSAHETDNYYPAVNSTGIAVWRNQDYEIFVSREGGAKKIGSDCHKAPLINDEGTIVFAGYDWDNYGSAIYIAEYKEVYDFSGRVVLNTNGGPGFEGVNINANDKVLATTSADGSFICSNLDPGTYTFSFSKPGYVFNPPAIEVGLNAHYTVPQNIVATPSTNIQILASEKQITVYPNPARNTLNIQLAGQFETIAQIKISDINGRVVKSISDKSLNNSAELKIDIPGFKPGQYNCLIIIDGKQIQKSFTVVK